MKSIIQKVILITIGALTCYNASAYDFEVNGIYYNVSSISSRTCGVTYGENKYSGDIVIPETVTYNGSEFTVTSIYGDYDNRTGAFSNCKITSVTLPNSITNIGPYAFSGCPYLITVKIPDNVNSIGEKAFYNCTSLTYIAIPGNVRSIGHSAFHNCTSLRELEIKDGNYELEFGTTTTSSYSYVTLAFSNCPIEKLYLGRNVDVDRVAYMVDIDMFSNNDKLKELTIGSPVTEITQSLLGGLTNLNKLIINDGDSPLTFTCHKNGIFESPTSLYLGRNCKMNYNDNYVYYTFFGGSVTDVTIGNSVTEIAPKLFKWGNISSIEIPNSVTTIGYEAFQWTSIKTVTIPPSVESIGSDAFDCETMAQVKSTGTIPPSIQDDTFTTDCYINGTLFIPKGTLSAYKATRWNNFLNIQEVDFGGVNGVEEDAVSVSAKEGSIVVSGTDNAAIEVYNLSGQLVYSGTDNVINVPSKGIYIVRVSGQTFKVIL